MQPEKSSYQVNVSGLSLKLKSSHDQQTVDELVSLVNNKVKEALDLGPNVSFQKALLLAALHLAEDLTLLKRTANSELAGLEDRAQKILSVLESSPTSRLGLDG